jgi:hypothetical protein
VAARAAELVARNENRRALASPVGSNRTYCKPENKVSLGFVERLNNKVRDFQCRANGLRDQEYLRLMVLTWMLPAL